MKKVCINLILTNVFLNYQSKCLSDTWLSDNSGGNTDGYQNKCYIVTNFTAL